MSRNTEAFRFLNEYFAENKESLVERLSRCKSITEVISIVIDVIRDVTSDYSIYGRELTVAQSEVMAELVAPINLALQTTSYAVIDIPDKNELWTAIDRSFKERTGKDFFKEILYSILAALGLYDTPDRRDLPESLVKVKVNTEEVLNLLQKLIEQLDAMVEKRASSKPIEEVKKPKEIEDDVLRILQETLGALHLSENQSVLKKQSDRIENLLKFYRISVEWPSDEDFSDLDTLENKYNVVLDSELEQTIVTKPCLLKAEEIWLKGEAVISE